MISERAHAECVRLLDLLTNKRVQESWSWVFMTPVTNIPGYDQIIKKPMDLGTVKKHLGSKPSRCRFKSHDKFARDVRLVFHNAMVYNKDDQHVRGSVFDAAQHLLRVFETAYAKAIETVFKAEDSATSSDALDEHESSGSGSGDKSVARPSGSASAGDAVVSAPRRERDASSSSAVGDLEPDQDGGGSSSQHHKTSHKTSHHKKSHKKESKKKHKKESKKKSSKDRDRHASSSSSDKKSKDKHKSSSSSREKERSRSDKHHDASDAAVAKPVSSSSASADPSAIRASASGANDASASSKNSSRRPETASTATEPLATAASSVAVVASAAPAKMSDSAIHACLGVLMKLIKYKEGSVSPAAPFLQPVELSHFPDYRIKVPARMHLYGVQKKLRNGGYADMNAFAYDVRLVFSNCLIYNSDVVLSKVMRSHAVTLMKLFETLFEKVGGHWPGVPERWKCHQILHEILAARTADGQETAMWFKYPIQTYFDSPDQIPYGYYKKIKVPMDIGTVSARLHLGEYTHARAFVKDVKLIFDNCLRYWKPDPQGQTYCESARALTHLLKTQVDHVFGAALSDELHLKDKQHKVSPSSSSSSATTVSGSSKTHRNSTGPTISTDDKSSKRKASKSSTLSNSGTAVPKETCLGIMKQLRAHKMKGYRGIDIPTAGPFLHAVDTTKYPDYLTIISEPMDFAKIERKLKGDRYGSTDEFSADVHLIFSNCHKYNSDPVEGADIRAMASSLRDYFVELYTEKLGHLASSGAAKPVETVKNEAAMTSKATAAAQVSKPASASAAGKHEALATAVSSSALDATKSVKAPSRSPTKRSSSEAMASASSARDAKKPHVAVAVPVTSVKHESALAASSVKDAVTKEPATASSRPAAVTASVPLKTKTEASVPVASAAASASGASSASPGPKTEPALSDAEELKRRKERKERKKERKEKKEKKRKSREKDKDKKAKKKERKDKSSSDDRRRVDATSASAAAAAPLATAPVSSSTAAKPVKPAATVSLAAPVPAPLGVATTAAGSKVAAAELPRTATSSSSSSTAKKSSSSSSSSSKKSSSSSSKKSDLSPWEASCERVLNRLQRIEQVAKLHFDQPLLEVFPQLQAEYARLIREPMDLRTLREQLHAHALATDADFVRRGRLIFQNAIAFNCASDPASLHVRELSSHLMWYFDSLCAELQLRGPETASPADAKAKQTQLRRERAALVALVPMDLKPKECLKLLRVLNSQKYDRNCWPFRKPVQVLFPALGPEYFDVIRTPMDLATISDKVAALEYKVHGDFMRDVRLTFENAIAYNKADKDRDGWSVYAAAVHMLSVAEDLWSDVTLEVTERLRRKDMLRKERERLGESHKKSKASSSDKRVERERLRIASDASSDAKRAAASASATAAVPSSLTAVKHALKASSDKVRAAAVASSSTASASAATAVLAAATIVAPAVAGSTSRDGAGDVSATRLKLSIVNRSAPTGSSSSSSNAPGASSSSAASGLNVDRMNKSERKAEEKRRKRARREEEIARSEKRRRTAVAATDDALREAEARSRRKLQKLEIAQAMKLREERDQRMREAEAERVLGMKMKFNAAMWSGVLVPAQQRSSQGFWTRKRVKLAPPAAFAAAVAPPIGSH